MKPSRESLFKQIRRIYWGVTDGNRVTADGSGPSAMLHMPSRHTSASRARRSGGLATYQGGTLIEWIVNPSMFACCITCPYVYVVESIHLFVEMREKGKRDSGGQLTLNPRKTEYTFTLHKAPKLCAIFRL